MRASVVMRPARGRFFVFAPSSQSSPTMPSALRADSTPPRENREATFRLVDQRTSQVVALVRTVFDEREGDDVRRAASVGGEPAGEVHGLVDVEADARDLEGVDPADLRRDG